MLIWIILNQIIPQREILGNYNFVQYLKVDELEGLLVRETVGVQNV